MRRHYRLSDEKSLPETISLFQSTLERTSIYRIEFSHLVVVKTVRRVEGDLICRKSRSALCSYYSYTTAFQRFRFENATDTLGSEARFP